MKQLFGISAHRRRLRLSVFTAGLLSLSFNALAQNVTIGGANFTESSILANIYASALKKNDIAVKTRLNLGNREIIIPALQSGEIDIVPEYLGALLNYYDGKTLATSQSDVSAELALGLPGLKRVYGLEFKAVKSLDMGGPLTRLALNSDTIDVATVVSTQGNLAKEDWVVLEDDKHEQPSQNVVPLVRKASLTPKISEVLNEVSGKLNNAALIELNQQVDLQHKDPAAVAEQWVKTHLNGN